MDVVQPIRAAQLHRAPNCSAGPLRQAIRGCDQLPQLGKLPSQRETRQLEFRHLGAPLARFMSALNIGFPWSCDATPKARLDLAYALRYVASRLRGSAHRGAQRSWAGGSRTRERPGVVRIAAHVTGALVRNPARRETCRLRREGCGDEQLSVSRDALRSVGGNHRR